ncbi:MAG: ribulose-phosphate 3-epimerase, partial [Candidatus Portnoybacteria bacterium]|nr:ribulose-phosphate 3-epimerase [Candidatus Portnoybacteria bacterium]
ELHLMLQDPDKTVLPWLKTPARRIIFHWEAKQGPHTWVWGLLRKIKNTGKEAGIALNPKTSQEKIYAFLKGIDSVLIMSVEPGFSGQVFMPEVLSKIKALRDKKFGGIIEVDGGMNEETIALVREAGADSLVVTKAIFDEPEPREALRQLNGRFKI